MTLIDLKPRPEYLKNRPKQNLGRWEDAKAAFAIIIFIGSLLLADFIDKL